MSFDNVINLTDFKVKKILGDMSYLDKSMSNIVINDRKRERLLSDIMQVKKEYEKKAVKSTQKS